MHGVLCVLKETIKALINREESILKHEKLYTKLYIDKNYAATNPINDGFVGSVREANYYTSKGNLKWEEHELSVLSTL